jgi:hypothetical protein
LLQSKINSWLHAATSTKENSTQGFFSLTE